MSAKLGIAASKITQVDFGQTNSTSRRLLSMTGAFSVESTSKSENDAMETALNLDLLNNVLGTASQQTITASSMDVQRRTIIPVAPVPPVIAPPRIETTPSPSESMPTWIWIAVGGSVGGIVVIVVVILVCYQYRRGHKPPHDATPTEKAKVDGAKFNVADSSYFYHSCGQYPYRIVDRV